MHQRQHLSCSPRVTAMASNTAPMLSSGYRTMTVFLSGSSPWQEPCCAHPSAHGLGPCPLQSHLVSRFFSSTLQSCHCFVRLSYEMQHRDTILQPITLSKHSNACCYAKPLPWAKYGTCDSIGIGVGKHLDISSVHEGEKITLSD